MNVPSRCARLAGADLALALAPFAANAGHARRTQGHPNRVVLVPGPVKERRTVRWMFEQCAAGRSFTQIARDLNAEGSTGSEENPGTTTVCRSSSSRTATWATWSTGAA